MAKWFLDPGHGGKDPGALGNNGRRECDVVLEAALRAKEVLEANGQTVAMSRTNDSFVSLGGICNKANASGADYFVSIHMNSAEGTALGTEVYHAPKCSATSVKFAELMVPIMYNGINSKMGYTTKNRGVKSANYYVIKNTNMPAILVEGDFINNNTVEKKFNAKIYGELIAQGCLTLIGKSTTIPNSGSSSSSGSSSGSSTPSTIKKKPFVNSNTRIEWVERLQKALNGAGYRDALGRTLTVDGKAGPNTVAAARKALLKSGSKGTLVSLVQEMLNCLGHNCGAIDGDYGPNTINGVKDFQSFNKLSSDGIFGPVSWTRVLGR